MPSVLHKLEDPSIRKAPAERPAAARVTGEYTYRLGVHELRVFVPRADPAVVAAFREGDVEIALAVEEPVLILCARFGAFPWTAAPFSAQSASRDPSTLPPPARALHEARALLHVSLVETETGKTRAERNVTLWLDFTRALHEAIRDQARLPYRPVEHDRAMARLRRRYPSDDILAASAVARSLGCP